MMSDPFIYSAYAGLGGLLSPLLTPWLHWRARNGKEILGRLGERSGIASRARPGGRLIWIHGASVGESLSALPMAQRIEAGDATVLFTTGTVTAAEIVEARLGSRSFHQFAPLDIETWIDRFLDHWRPDAAIRIESEIWPATLVSLSRRRIPIIAVNARLSQRSARGWRRWPGLARRLFGALSAVGAQSDRDAALFAELGSPNVASVGNMKFSTPPLSSDPTALNEANRQARGRPRWVAASIHPGEDVVVGQAHVAVSRHIPRALLVAVPRHPERAIGMAATMTRLGLKVARRSLGQGIADDTDVLLADTMGELGLFYRLCPVSFIGKTLAVGGGQNPIEPAQLGSAMTWGPDMSNFHDLAASFEVSHAAIKVADAEQLGATIAKLLTTADLRDAMTTRATALIAANAGALDRTMNMIRPYLGEAGLRS